MGHVSCFPLALTSIYFWLKRLRVYPKNSFRRPGSSEKQPGGGAGFWDRQVSNKLVFSSVVDRRTLSSWPSRWDVSWWFVSFGGFNSLLIDISAIPLMATTVRQDWRTEERNCARSLRTNLDAMEFLGLPPRQRLTFSYSP